MAKTRRRSPPAMPLGRVLGLVGGLALVGAALDAVLGREPAAVE